MMYVLELMRYVDEGSFSDESRSARAVLNRLDAAPTELKHTPLLKAA